jgi:hypothetical protein
MTPCQLGFDDNVSSRNRNADERNVDEFKFSRERREECFEKVIGKAWVVCLEMLPVEFELYNKLIACSVLMEQFRDFLHPFWRISGKWQLGRCGLAA